MVVIEPIAVVVFPIAVCAMFRRSWSFIFLLVSVPFFALEVVTALGHPFNPPEIALIILGIHLVIDWLSRGRLVLYNKGPVLFLWAFLVVIAVSMIWAVLNPPSVLVHPYDATFQSRLFVTATFNHSYITQFFLRVFFVFAITVLTIILVRDQNIIVATRGIVYGAVVVGVVGLAYQAAIVLDLSVIPELLRTIGFRRFPTNPGRLGPIPRMYSTSGEPGFTANYLLYSLAITTTLLIVPGNRWAFSRRELRTLTGFLGVALLLSTGTTGYGGLIILGGILIILLSFFPSTRRGDFRQIITVAGVGMSLTAVLLVLIAPQFIDIIAFQLKKITFQAGSGNIRLFYIEKSLDVFRSRPLLGAGVGSHAAPSYLPTLLAETGVLGAGTLLGAHLLAYRQCAGLSNRVNSATKWGASALAVAGVTLLATNLVAKSIASLLMPWYWFSLALPIAFVAQSSIRKQPTEEQEDPNTPLIRDNRSKS